MFLQRIAQTFYSEYKADIRKFTFVFPNRRAGLFFRKYLAQITDKPIFSPEIITITDCFFQSSAYALIDRTAALFHLYRIYKQLSKNSESFDAFVFWGEMLLADFDDVDKNRVDASMLFKNVSAFKEIDWADEYITIAQREAIKNFWDHFMPVPDNKTKEDFILVWKILLPLYKQFREELKAENLATEGMIYAEVADKMQKGDVPDYFKDKSFVFIGFNALNQCEKRLFLELQKRGCADFYWDYESSELQDTDNPASHFFEEYTRTFHSKFAIEKNTVPLSERNFRQIAIPSAVGQTKQVYHLLSSLYPSGTVDSDWIKTAVVLPDESLLVPLLHSLPESIEKINVTMGFPLKTTPAAGLMEHVFDLHRRINSKGLFYHQSVTNILNHQYVKVLCRDEAERLGRQIVQTNAVYVSQEMFGENELLSMIFTPQNEPIAFTDYLLNVLKTLNEGWQTFSEERGDYGLECGYLYQYYTAINRLNDVLKKNTNKAFEIGLDTLIRIIRQLISGISIPFEGEPLDGLQVMGVLETRGLDFENLIICSFNEGVFPKKNSSGSFIPYNLRRAFELPTLQTQDIVSAYNFYRLLQRARNVYFLYDSRTEGMQSGEISRYAYQLEYHYGVRFERIHVSYDVNVNSEQPLVVRKTPEVMAKLSNFLTTAQTTSRYLSASAINTYIHCPLQFYFSTIERMAEPEEVQEKVESAMFGTLLHYVMEVLYKPFEGKMLSKSELEALSKHTLLMDKTIMQAFGVHFFNKSAEAEIDFELTGSNLLTARVLKKFIAQIIRRDAEKAPFRYIHSEKRLKIRFPICEGTKNVNLQGVIDRVDETNDGVIRILDYKTGRDKLEFNALEEVFERNKKERPKAVFQTFFYGLLYMKDTGVHDVVPEVMKIRDLFKSDFSTQLTDKSKKEPVISFTDYKTAFEENLTAVLEEMFHPDIPFDQCADTTQCQWCAFKPICRRF